jgi:hypothetical protein
MTSLKTSTLMRTLNIGAVLACGLGLLAQANEPLFGVWQLNVAKSKYTPGPAPRNSSKRYEPYRGGLKASQDTTTAKGDVQHIEIVGALDGKDYPATGNPEIDTYSFRKVADRTYEIVQKKAGKEIYRVSTTVAPDGKTRSVQQTGKNAKGEAVANEMLWERQ